MEQTAPGQIPPLQVKRALHRNIVAGCFGMLFATCTSLQFATQFALELGASKFHIGLLTSLPMLGFPLQLVSAYIVERLRRRKPFWFFTAALSRLLWVLVLLIPFTLGRAFPQAQVFVFLLLVFLSNALATMATGPWFSWMADLVPPEQAGRFWSRRTAVLNICMLSSLLFGRFVDLFPKSADAAPGSWVPFIPFAVLFGLGFLLGEIDLLIHNRIPEPPMRQSPRPLHVLAMLKEPIQNPRFRRFVVWNCAWSFSVTFYSAYLMVFFLEQLHLSQFFIGVLVSVAMGARYLMSRYWGYLADRFGHTAVNTICDVGLLVVPFALLLVTPQNCVWLLILIHVWGGAFGIGLDAASTSLMLRLSTAENKSMSLAVLYSLVGLIAAAAPPLGGWVLQHFEGEQTRFMLWQFDHFQMLFLTGLFLRLLFFPFTLRLDDVGGGTTALVVRRLMDTNPFRVIRHVHVLSESAGEAERLAAVQQLASTRSSIATRELVEALEDPSRDVRMEAALALGRIGDAEAVEPLLRCLRSPDSGIQPQAAYALGKIRDPAAVPALLEALSDPLLTRAAATALGEIGDRRAVPALLQLLRQPGTPEQTRASVAYALSRLREVSALPDMLAAFQQTRLHLVRQEMALAIANLFGRPGEFYHLLTRERRVAGQEVLRLQEQVLRGRARFRHNSVLIEQVIQQLEQGLGCYSREQWAEASRAFARAGLLLSGSVPGEPAANGMFDFLADWWPTHRRKIEDRLAQRDPGSAPLWFLLAVTYPQSAETAAASSREEALLAFYAFWRIWQSKSG